MYIERPGRTLRVKTWADSIPEGASFGITQAATMVKLTIPDNVSRSGYGGQTVARILCDACGWFRDGATLTKMRPGQRHVMPAAEGFRLWSLVAPHRASAKDMAAHFNQWSAGRYATVSARGMVDGLRLHGYKVISRPHNVAVYGREADII